MIYILILNVFLLIGEWIAGFLALKAGQVRVTIAIAFIMCLQLWFIYTVLLIIKNQKVAKQEGMNQFISSFERSESHENKINK